MLSFYNDCPLLPPWAALDEFTKRRPGTLLSVSYWHVPVRWRLVLFFLLCSTLINVWVPPLSAPVSIALHTHTWHFLCFWIFLKPLILLIIRFGIFCITGHWGLLQTVFCFTHHCLFYNKVSCWPLIACRLSHWYIFRAILGKVPFYLSSFLEWKQGGHNLILHGLNGLKESC